MKRHLIPTVGAILFGTGLAVTELPAQTVTLLESFEDNIDNVTVVGGGNRGEADIAFSVHTKTGDDDLSVTDGEKALKITISNNLAWNRDADITLSEEASDIVKAAWASNDEARYVIRYDVQFNDEGVGWGNFITWVNGRPYGQLELGSGLNNSFSLPLDVMGTDLSGDDPVVLNIVGQYDTGGGATTKDVIVDNIRLIDNYASGAVPEITLLNGFETEEDVDKLVPVSDRYTASLHTRTGPADIAVTQGDGSLQIDFMDGGGWTRDFTIPFKGTIMESIARLPQEDRWRYTFRLDYIFAAAEGDNWPSDWQNVILRTASGSAQPVTMFRGDPSQHVRTLSVPLDNLIVEPGDPGNPDDVNPGISITNQGAWQNEMTLYIDNIRVIDTGKAPLKIGDLTANEAGGVDISWASSPSQAYGISVSSNLRDWSDLVTGVVGTPGGETTVYSLSSEDLVDQNFYRIYVSGAAPPLNEGFENGAEGWTAKVAENNTGTTVWEVGTPTNGPGAAKTGTGVVGTDLDADITAGTWVVFESPVASLGPILDPQLTFSYYLESGPNSAARVNILAADGSEIYAPTTDDELYYTENTDGWQEVVFDIADVAGGQKIILQFEFIGNDVGAGFFIDDVLIDEKP